MPIRLVAIDLDGTLLDGNATVSSANREALAQVDARGVQIAVVTGRRYQSAQKILEQLPCSVTLISSNGAMIVSSSGEILHRDFLPRALALRVLQEVREYRPYAVAIFEIPGRGQIVMQDCATPEGPLGWYQSHSPGLLVRVPDLESYLSTDPIQLMFGGPPDRVGPLEPFLLSRFEPPEFHLTWTKYLGRNLSILDVMNRGCTKGRALAHWAASKGIDATEVMAIGDNFNDLEMLRFAGVPVVMANSTPGLNQAGWHETCSNEQNGVAAALEKFVLEPARSAKTS
jgi:hydroxymethylpyrimidine pyrophosphatase-like HAD family hydrolase